MPLFRRHSPEPDPETEATLVVRAMQLEPVAVFLEAEVVEGWLATQDRRPSERLNAGEPLHVQLLSPNAEPGPWADYFPDDMIAVAVAPRLQPSLLRVSRRRYVMELGADPYAFSGTAHMPPGADPLRYADGASHRWQPLTQGTVTMGEDNWAVDVLLVNLKRVSRATATQLD